MAQDVINNSLHVNGTLTCASFTPPAGSVTNSAIQAAAGIDATKVVQQHLKLYAQVHGTAATTERRVVHVAQGSGTIVEFNAGAVVACVGAATITFDLRKNGTTVLSSVITNSSADAAYAVEGGTLSVTTYAADDVFEVVVTATAGGGTLGQGAFCQATFRENPQ